MLSESSLLLFSPAIYISFIFFFFNDTATTEIYTLSLHDALPICTTCASSGDCPSATWPPPPASTIPTSRSWSAAASASTIRSEEHTSELQSRLHLVCRLLLEKKKIKTHHSKACYTFSSYTRPRMT